jgi:hypothetical protein
MRKSDHLNTFSPYHNLKSLSKLSLITSGLLVFPVNRSFFSVTLRFKLYSMSDFGCSSAGYKEFFLDMTPYSQEEVSVLTFSGTYSLYRQSAYIPWRRKQHIRIEPLFISARPHGVIYIMIYKFEDIEKCEFSRGHAMKAYVWVEDIVYALNVGTRWRWVVILTLRPL